MSKLDTRVIQTAKGISTIQMARTVSNPIVLKKHDVQLQTLYTHLGISYDELPHNFELPAKLHLSYTLDGRRIITVISTTLDSVRYLIVNAGRGGHDYGEVYKIDFSSPKEEYLKPGCSLISEIDIADEELILTHEDWYPTQWSNNMTEEYTKEDLCNDTFALIKLHYPIKGIRTNTSEFTSLKNISLGYKVDDKGEAILIINKDPFYETIVLSNFESFSEVCLVVYRQLNLLSTEATPDFIEQLKEVVQQQLSGLLFVQQQYDTAKKLLGLDD